MSKTKNEIQREYEQRTGYAAQAKYRSKYTKRITFDVNIRTEADILDKLTSEPNKQGYIKRLIREDIKKTEKNFMSQAAKAENN